jgi:hypothetical protein
MGNKHQSNKEVKKKPAMTLLEKRAAKKLKKVPKTMLVDIGARGSIANWR